MGEWGKGRALGNRHPCFVRLLHRWLLSHCRCGADWQVSWVFLSWNSLTSNRAACSCAGKTTPPSHGDFSAGSSATENRQFCVFAHLLLQILICTSLTFNRLLICSLAFSLLVNFLVDWLLIVLRFVDHRCKKHIGVYYSCHVFYIY